MYKKIMLILLCSFFVPVSILKAKLPPAEVNLNYSDGNVTVVTKMNYQKDVIQQVKSQGVSVDLSITPSLCVDNNLKLTVMPHSTHFSMGSDQLKQLTLFLLSFVKAYQDDIKSGASEFNVKLDIIDRSSGGSQIGYSQTTLKEAVSCHECIIRCPDGSESSGTPYYTVITPTSVSSPLASQRSSDSGVSGMRYLGGSEGDGDGDRQGEPAHALGFYDYCYACKHYFCTRFFSNAQEWEMCVNAFNAGYKQRSYEDSCRSGYRSSSNLNNGNQDYQTSHAVQSGTPEVGSGWMSGMVKNTHAVCTTTSFNDSVEVSCTTASGSTSSAEHEVAGMHQGAGDADYDGLISFLLSECEKKDYSDDFALSLQDPVIAGAMVPSFISSDSTTSVKHHNVVPGANAVLKSNAGAPGEYEKVSTKKEGIVGFLFQLLIDNNEGIKWLDKENGLFKIEKTHSGTIARSWGEKKNNPNMNYSSMSRGIRERREKGEMSTVTELEKAKHGGKLIFQFNLTHQSNDYMNEEIRRQLKK